MRSIYKTKTTGNYYNYGRPATDYRDKFEESARGILEEHFNVESITFHSDKIKSRGVGVEGWRVTPYAYILMTPKDAGVDTIPTLKLDFDFLDTSGFAVLPIGSDTISIDASKAGERPMTNLKITQTLDERAKPRTASSSWRSKPAPTASSRTSKRSSN